MIITYWCIYSPKDGDIVFLTNLGNKITVKYNHQAIIDFSYHSKTYKVPGRMTSIDIESRCENIDTMLILRFGDRITKVGEDYVDIW